MSLLPSKTDVHAAVVDLLQSKIEGLSVRIAEAQQAASEDTKSSAGDKFETSREMIRQEIDKANAQLGSFRQMQVLVEKISVGQKSGEVGFGSLVETSEATYFFSVSLGKLGVKGKEVYALSLASPLGKSLHGKRVGEKVSFRGRDLEILHIT